MSDCEFENYLTLIGRLLRLSSAQRQAIGEELRDHFESRIEELTGRGVPHAQAVQIAVEEFGDAAGLAAQFSSISQTRKRRMIMRCTVASVAALAAAMVVTISIWPEHHGVALIDNAVAQQTEKPKSDVDQAKLDKLEKAAVELPDDLNAQTEAKLNKFTIADFPDPIPLTDFMDRIAEKFDLQTIIDQQALKDAGVDPTATLVQIRLKHVRGSMLLKLALGEFNLGYTIRDGILIISSKDKLGSELVMRVYDCREILSQDKALPAIPTSYNFDVRIPHSAVLRTVDSRDDSTMDSISPYLHFVQLAGVPNSPSNSNKPLPEPKTPADRLIRVITSVIEPPTWDTEGGPGSICEFAGLLVVCQTTEAHSQIADLLSQIQGKLASRSAK